MSLSTFYSNISQMQMSCNENVIKRFLDTSEFFLTLLRPSKHVKVSPSKLAQ